MHHLIRSYCKKKQYDTIGLYEHLMTLTRVEVRGEEMDVQTWIDKEGGLLQSSVTDPICIRERDIHFGVAALIERHTRLKNGDASCAKTDVYVLTPEVIHRCHKQKWIESKLQETLEIYENTPDLEYIDGTFPQDAFETFMEGTERTNSASYREELEAEYYTRYPKLKLNPTPS